MQEQEHGQFADSERDDMEMESNELDTQAGSKADASAGARQQKKSGRGFAGMSEEQRRAIASKGGSAQGKHNNSGNFANDREKAVTAGRLGGQHSRGGGRASQESSENTDADI